MAVASAPAARVRIVRAQARREARPAGSGGAQRRDGVSDRTSATAPAPRSTRSRRCGACWRCRRCRAASSASTSRRFRARDRRVDGRRASKAGCESESGVPASSRSRSQAASRSESDRLMISPRCTRSCCAAISALLEQGGPFPDLILIDGGKGQLTAAYAALARGRARAAGRGRPGEAGGADLHARSGRGPRAAARVAGAAAAAADPRRGAPLRRHVPPAVRGAKRDSRRRSTRSPASVRAGASSCSTAFGSVAGVRRASREELARGRRRQGRRRGDSTTSGT